MSGARAARAGRLHAPLVLLMLAGCISTLGPGDLPPQLPQTARLVEVPFHAQERHQCGPASLAMALNAAGDPATPDELVPQTFTPEREGSLQTEMVTAVRRRGRLALAVSDPASLFAEIANGHPVVVLQNLAFGWYPIWHYAVVIGYDLRRGRVTLRSGDIRTREIRMDVFLRTWRRSDSWGIVVVEPGDLPASTRERLYLDAVIGLERAGRPEAAAMAYAAALERWPGSFGAAVGLGNSRYALGDLPGAEDALRRALAIDPEDPGALHNLARVLAEQGRRDEALAAARRALAHGGQHSSVYEETLREIEAGGAEEEDEGGDLR